MPRTATTPTRPATAAQIVTGQDYRRVRLLSLHASAKQVAALVGVHPLTLDAWERNAAPIEEPRATEWRRALALAAAARRTQLAKAGITDEQIAGTDFGRAYAALTTSEASR